MTLTSTQRRHLRALAHHLHPVVQLGTAGLTDGVVRATDEALDAHELIKVRIEGERAARKTMGEGLAERTRAEIAQVIGRVAALYRPAKDKERRRISLPR